MRRASESLMDWHARVLREGSPMDAWLEESCQAEIDAERDAIAFAERFRAALATPKEPTHE